MSDTAKVCALCGCDCSDRPRVKDARGRYYCKECYEGAGRKAESPATAGAVRSGRVPPDDPDPLMDLLQAERTSEPASQQQSGCPNCGGALTGVICMSCGYDARTGKRIAMQMQMAPGGDADAGAAPARSAGLAVLKGLLGGSTPLILGIAAGVVGAVIWAAIAYYADLQIGWIAILVGGMVGLAVAAGGGSGQTAGVMAAAIAVGAICAGKVGAMYSYVGTFTEKEFGGLLTPAIYQDLKGNAEEFAKLKDRSEYPAFMVKRGLDTEAESAGDVTAEEVAEFEAETVPVMRAFNDSPPSYEQWKKQRLKEATAAIRRDVSFLEMLKASLGAMDALFFLLAIAAAYRIPAGSN